MDITCENKMFVQIASGQYNLNFKAEFTAWDTPQQNGIVEVTIATIAEQS